MSRKIAYHSRLKLDRDSDIYDDMSPGIPGARKAYSEALFSAMKSKERKTSSWDKSSSYGQQSDQYSYQYNNSVSSSRRFVIFGILTTLGLGGTIWGVRKKRLKNKQIELEALRAELKEQQRLKDKLEEDKRTKEKIKYKPSREFNLKKGLAKIGIPDEKIDNIINSVVAIRCEGGHGSGFFIGKDIMLTAGHVVSRYTDARFYNYSKVKKPDRIIDIKGNIYLPLEVYGDDSNDIAIIKVAGVGEGFIDIEDIETESIRRAAIGFSQGVDNPSVTIGIKLERDGPTDLMNGDRNSNNIRDGLQQGFLSNPVSHGDSGGPVVNANGNLVGIITQKRRSYDYDSLGIIEPLDDIKDFIKEVKAKL